MTNTPLPQNINFSISEWGSLSYLASILFGVVGGGWGLYKHIQSRQKKELSYSIIADNLLASIYEELPTLHKIKISVGDKDVKNIRFVMIRIQNTGNMVINAEDIEYPISFVSTQLLESNTLIGGYVAESVPQNVMASVVRHENIQMVGLEQCTINKKERIDVALLFADYDQPITATARIKGGEFKHVDVLNPSSPWWTQTLFSWIVFHLLLSIVLTSSLFFILKTDLFKTFGVILLTLLIPTLIIWGFNKLKNARK